MWNNPHEVARAVGHICGAVANLYKIKKEKIILLNQPDCKFKFVRTFSQTLQQNAPTLPKHFQLFIEK